MFDKYEVVRRLQNGETLDEIADSMTAALNDAANEYEQSKQETERDNKISDMGEILDLVHDYLLNYYAHSYEDIDAIDDTFSKDMVEEIVDGIDIAYNEVNSFFDYLKSKEEPCVCKCKKKKADLPDNLKELADLPNVAVLNMSDADAEDQLHSFLDMFINKMNKENQ